MDYRCTFIGESNGKTDDFLLRIRVPVTTLCPCSKEISDYGAHNQRGLVTSPFANRKNGLWELIWIEELIEIAERSASAPSIRSSSARRAATSPCKRSTTRLRRRLVRNAARLLRQDKRITWFEVRAVNQESIHNHSAFAEVRSPQ